ACVRAARRCRAPAGTAATLRSRRRRLPGTPARRRAGDPARSSHAPAVRPARERAPWGWRRSLRRRGTAPPPRRSPPRPCSPRSRGHLPRETPHLGLLGGFVTGEEPVDERGPSLGVLGVVDIVLLERLVPPVVGRRRGEMRTARRFDHS